MTKEESQKELIEEMEKIGFKAMLVDECGNTALVRHFQWGTLLISSYTLGQELLQIPSDRHEDLLVLVESGDGEVILALPSTFEKIFQCMLALDLFHMMKNLPSN